MEFEFEENQDERNNRAITTRKYQPSIIQISTNKTKVEFNAEFAAATP